MGTEVQHNQVSQLNEIVNTTVIEIVVGEKQLFEVNKPHQRSCTFIG